MNVYKDNYQTKEVVVEDIMEKLTDKVDQQRKMIKRKSEQLEKKKKEREENVVRISWIRTGWLSIQ